MCGFLFYFFPPILRNITFLVNQDGRDVTLNLTLKALAAEFAIFEPDDFHLWFGNYLATVLASLLPPSLEVIPRNISCASFAAM